MGVAAITARSGGHADAVLVRRFRQAQTERERAAVFAELVRRHRDAVLGCCAERLWPDADAAVADSEKLPRPDRLRAWLLGIAGNNALTSGLPARIDDINWEAVQAHVARDVPEMRDSPARRASLRHWVRKLPLTRQTVLRPGAENCGRYWLMLGTTAMRSSAVGGTSWCCLLPFD
jgi:hypothetical protein